MNSELELLNLDIERAKTRAQEIVCYGNSERTAMLHPQDSITSYDRYVNVRDTISTIFLMASMIGGLLGSLITMGMFAFHESLAELPGSKVLGIVLSLGIMLVGAGYVPMRSLKGVDEVKRAGLAVRLNIIDHLPCTNSNQHVAVKYYNYALAAAKEVQADTTAPDKFHQVAAGIVDTLTEVYENLTSVDHTAVIVETEWENLTSQLQEIAVDAVTLQEVNRQRKEVHRKAVRIRASYGASNKTELQEALTTAEEEVAEIHKALTPRALPSHTMERQTA